MDAIDLCFAGAAEQARLVAAGEVSARELVEATLARIAEQQPRLNAYRVVLDDAALAAADAIDAAAGEGVLRGVPVAVKDDIDVAGEVTAMGTAGARPAKQHDAELVRRLRDAGAIVIGKTHVPELMMIPATDSTTYGATRNPWDLSRTPGGSSGGSGAAAAAGLCGVAVGSDGAGSIRTPAAWCGLVGLKPQRDRVPMAPHDDGWQGMSVNGPLARHAADAALLMDAVDPGNGFAAAAASGPGRRLRVALSTKAPPGSRFRLGREERAALQATAERLRALGHEVLERDPDYPPSLWSAAYTRVLRGIHDDLELEIAHPERLEARTRRVAALGGWIPKAAVARARAAERGQAARIAALFDDCDVLLTPACADGPYRAGEMGRRGLGGWLATAAERIPYFAAFNVTGQPAISVPASSDDDGLPIGVQLVARSRDDVTLLALAGELERDGAIADRRPPA